MTSMMKTGYSVGDAMTPKVISVAPSATLQEAAALMAEKRIGSLLVLEGSDLLGIFTEQDLVRKAMAEDKIPSSVTVTEVMNKGVVTIAPEEDILYAIQVMRDNSVRHLPVVNDGAVVGMVTMKDILNINPELFEIVAEKMVLGAKKFG